MSTSLNHALKEALRQAELSYEDLARAVRAVAAEAGDSLRTNKSAVAHWVSGRRPSPQTAAYIAEALSRRLGHIVHPSELGLEQALASAATEQAPALLGLRLGPDPVDMLRRLGDADIQRRQFVTSAAYSVSAAALPLGAKQAIEYQKRAHTGRAGRAEIGAVRDMVTMYTRIDERHGGQHGRSAVVQYLTGDVARLCRADFATEQHRADMLSGAAAVAYLCGWKAYDASEHGLVIYSS